MRYPSIIVAFLSLVTLPMAAKTFMTQQQALDAAFPKGTVLERQSIFLSATEASVAKSTSGVDFDDELVVRYVGKAAGAIVGYVYFDAHRVRTLPETLMIVVRTDGTIDRIEILSFSEPQDYLPKARWIDQLDEKKLDDELSLKRSIRPISGATLSGRAIVNASRKILAIHGVIQARTVARKGAVK